MFRVGFIAVSWNPASYGGEGTLFRSDMPLLCSSEYGYVEPTYSALSTRCRR